MGLAEQPCREPWGRGSRWAACRGRVAAASGALALAAGAAAVSALLGQFPAAVLCGGVGTGVGGSVLGTGLFSSSRGTRRAASSQRLVRRAALDPYVVLGLERTASVEQVKSRYRRLIREHHPDLRHHEGTSQRLQEIVEASKAILTRMSKGGRRHQGGASSAARRARQRAEVHLYSGFSRHPRGDQYVITTLGIEVQWAPDPYTKRWQSSKRVIRFSDVRHVSRQVKLRGREGVYDLELELFWGSRLLLQELPRAVVEQIIQIVEAVRLQFLAQRARMLYRCVVGEFAAARRSVVYQ